MPITTPTIIFKGKEVLRFDSVADVDRMLEGFAAAGQVIQGHEVIAVGLQPPYMIFQRGLENDPEVYMKIHETYTPVVDARQFNRQRVIMQIAANDDNRSAAAHYLPEIDALICVNGSGNADSPYDFFVFGEAFRNTDLQPWQQELLETAQYSQVLGHASVSSLKATHAVAFHREITPEVREVLRKYMNLKG